MTGINLGKLTSMHFYAWKKGLKTGMYYLRSKAAADAIKFTVDAKAIRESTGTKEEQNKENELRENEPRKESVGAEDIDKWRAVSGSGG